MRKDITVEKLKLGGTKVNKTLLDNSIVVGKLLIED